MTFTSGASGDPFGSSAPLLSLRLCCRKTSNPDGKLVATFYGLIANHAGIWVVMSRDDDISAYLTIMEGASLAAISSGYCGEIVVGISGGKAERDEIAAALEKLTPTQSCRIRLSQDGETTGFPLRRLANLARLAGEGQLPSSDALSDALEIFRDRLSGDPAIFDPAPQSSAPSHAPLTEDWPEHRISTYPVTRFAGPPGGGKTRLLAALFGIPWRLMPQASGPGQHLINDPEMSDFRIEVRFRTRMETMVRLSSCIFDSILSGYVDGQIQLSDDSPHLSRLGNDISILDILGTPQQSDPVWSGILQALDGCLAEAHAGRLDRCNGMVRVAAGMVADTIRSQIIDLPFGDVEFTPSGEMVALRYQTASKSDALRVMAYFAPPHPEHPSFYHICDRIRFAGPFVDDHPGFVIVDELSGFADRTALVEKAGHAGESVDIAMAAAADGPVFSVLAMFDETPDLGAGGHEIRRLRQAWSAIPGGERFLRDFPPFCFGDLLFHDADTISLAPLSGISGPNPAEALRLMHALSTPAPLTSAERLSRGRNLDLEKRRRAAEDSLWGEVFRLRKQLFLNM